MTTLPDSSQNQLRQFVEQIERLEQDKKALSDDIRDKYLEAKAVGFDVKALRTIVRMRKKSKTEREEEESILDVYLHALGMLADTPLGVAAVRAEFGDATVSINGGPHYPVEMVHAAIDVVQNNAKMREAAE